jgi:hypothetical protein
MRRENPEGHQTRKRRRTRGILRPDPKGFFDFAPPGAAAFITTIKSFLVFGDEAITSSAMQFSNFK